MPVSGLFEPHTTRPRDPPRAQVRGAAPPSDERRTPIANWRVRGCRLAAAMRSPERRARRSFEGAQDRRICPRFRYRSARCCSFGKLALDFGFELALVGESHRHDRWERKCRGLPLRDEYRSGGKPDLRCEFRPGGRRRPRLRPPRAKLTRITFERRFDPGAAKPKADLATGDTLLGGQMMALAIDPKGSVKGCQ